MRTRLAYLLFAFAVCGTGCQFQWAAKPIWNTPEPKSADLPLAERQLLAPDVSAITEPSAPLPSPGYYQLTADECRDLACRNSTAANLIESSVTVHPGPFTHCNGQAEIDYLRMVAAENLSREARNRTAAAALTLYYKLLEIELSSDVLKNSVTELDELIRTGDQLREKGFKVADDGYDLKKQRIELNTQQTKARAGIAKLNAELKTLLAIDPATTGLLLPADQVRVVADLLDADSAVQVGLARRADLNLIRQLCNCVDARTIVAIRQVLIGLTPILGAVTAPLREALALSPFVSAMAKAEASALRKQLVALQMDREREASKDIRSAVGEWIAARDVVANARKKFELNQTQVEELKKRKDLGQAVELELRKAQLELLKAEAELIREVIAWKLADVKAREAMGILCCE